MKIRTMKGSLLDGMNAVSGAVGAKGGLPALRNVRIDATGEYASLTATNLDVQVEYRMKCDVDEPGVVLLDATAFGAVVKALPGGPCEVEGGNHGTARIEGGEVKYGMQVCNPADFPVPPVAGEGGTEVALPAVTLAAMIRLVRWAVCKDATRKSLGGVNLAFADGKLTAVATNGMSLATIEHEIDRAGEFRVTLPMAAVDLLRTLLKGEADGDVSVWTDGKRIRFMCGDWAMTAKVVDEVFPNWRQVIPGKAAQNVVVDRELFLLELDRADAANVNGGVGVRVTFEDGQCSFAVRNAFAHTKITMDAKHAGERFTMSVDPNLLRLALLATEESEVTFGLGTDGTQAITVVATIPWIAVIMPMRSE